MSEYHISELLDKQQEQEVMADAEMRRLPDGSLTQEEVNALLARIEELETEAKRPRWHHDWNQPPEAPHFCEECANLIQQNRDVRTALRMSSMLFHGCDHHRGEFIDCEVGTCEQARAALAREEK